MNRYLDESGYKYGIEHESALINPCNEFSDFANTSFEQLNVIISDLPKYPSDYPDLRIGDVNVKVKRWYIEGFERYDNNGAYLTTVPKGIEIRTPVSTTIAEAVKHVKEDRNKLMSAAHKQNFELVSVSFNPFRKEYTIKPSLNDWEIAHRQGSEVTTAPIYMMSYGPDINISHVNLTDEDLIDIGKKLNYYSPFIIPYSFSSPFYMGQPWGGLSKRTYYRAGKRPAVLVYLSDESKLIKSKVPLTELARIKAEAGRIEFKSLDACSDIDLYSAYISLIKGLIIDNSLKERAIVSDAKLHQHCATVGLHDNEILRQAQLVLNASEAALEDADKVFLDPLKQQLLDRSCKADNQLDLFKTNNDIIKTLEELT